MRRFPSKSTTIPGCRAAASNSLTLSTGARYKFSERIQLGLVGEVPLTSNKDLMAYRITFDVIFRY